jgi:hypothetical protein
MSRLVILLLPINSPQHYHQSTPAASVERFKINSPDIEGGEGIDTILGCLLADKVFVIILRNVTQDSWLKLQWLGQELAD